MVVWWDSSRLPNYSTLLGVIQHLLGVILVGSHIPYYCTVASRRCWNQYQAWRSYYLFSEVSLRKPLHYLNCPNNSPQQLPLLHLFHKVHARLFYTSPHHADRRTTPWYHGIAAGGDEKVWLGTNNTHQTLSQKLAYQNSHSKQIHNSIVYNRKSIQTTFPDGPNQTGQREGLSTGNIGNNRDRSWNIGTIYTCHIHSVVKGELSWPGVDLHLSKVHCRHPLVPQAESL